MNPDQVDLHRFARSGGEATSLSANPMASALGARLLRVDLLVGVVELSFDPDGVFIQGAGVLQGGAVAAMLDFAMAFAVLALLDVEQACSTASLNVSFLRAAPRGRYVAVGEIERRGRQLAFTRARLYPEGDPTRWVATASSTLAILG